MSSISEVKVGSIIRVKVGRNTILAKVLEIHEGALHVCSVGKNREFNISPNRVELGGEAAEQEQAVTPANTEATEQAEQSAEQEAVEPETEEPATVEVLPEDEAAEQAEAETEEQSEVNTAGQPEESEPGEPATVEVLPEDEAAEFTPSGEDEEDEYAINPAHESDKPQKRMSLLNAAVEVLKTAGPEHPMNCKEILEAIYERKLWTPTDCKTPEQTLYGSIFREINTKEHPRIMKSDVKGKFRIAD